jgi:ribose transport system substrate-binding protein
LLGRDGDAGFYRSSDGGWDSADQPIEGGDFVLVTAMVTDGDESAATDQVTKLLEDGEPIQAIIGLFPGGVPASVAALKEANKLGEVKLFGYGQDTDSLVAVRDGHCEALIVEDPVALGQEVTRTLKNVIHLQRSKLPDDRYATVPARTVTKDNFDQFVSDWREKLSAATAKKTD